MFAKKDEISGDMKRKNDDIKKVGYISDSNNASDILSITWESIQ
jgi:hypothetical protein